MGRPQWTSVERLDLAAGRKCCDSCDKRLPLAAFKEDSDVGGLPPARQPSRNATPGCRCRPKIACFQRGVVNNAAVFLPTCAMDLLYEIARLNPPGSGPPSKCKGHEALFSTFSKDCKCRAAQFSRTALQRNRAGDLVPPDSGSHLPARMLFEHAAIRAGAVGQCSLPLDGAGRPAPCSQRRPAAARRRAHALGGRVRAERLDQGRPADEEGQRGHLSQDLAERTRRGVARSVAAAPRRAHRVEVADRVWAAHAARRREDQRRQLEQPTRRGRGAAPQTAETRVRRARCRLRAPPSGPRGGGAAADASATRPNVPDVRYRATRRVDSARGHPRPPSGHRATLRQVRSHARR